MANTNKILSVEKVTKTFGKGNSLTKAVDNLSFSVKKGEFLAIMGASGSGKSTTLNLISTIDRPTSGQILVDGTDITKLKGEKLNRFRRESLGFIFQDFNLLDNLTAYENIALALSIQNVKASEIDERVKAVAKNLDIESILQKFPYQLSGGQKQRLSIARAVVKDPDIFIFDDSFSALDYKTDATLRKRLKEVTGDATVLIVAQRVGTIMDADQIIVLDQGEIVGRGTHDELMESNEIYREIANSQLDSPSLTEE